MTGGEGAAALGGDFPHATLGVWDLAVAIACLQSPNAAKRKKALKLLNARLLPRGQCPAGGIILHN